MAALDNNLAALAAVLFFVLLACDRGKAEIDEIVRDLNGRRLNGQRRQPAAA
jgi:hypothetical protein